MNIRRGLWRTWIAGSGLWAGLVVLFTTSGSPAMFQRELTDDEAFGRPAPTAQQWPGVLVPAGQPSWMSAPAVEPGRVTASNPFDHFDAQQPDAGVPAGPPARSQSAPAAAWRLNPAFVREWTTAFWVATIPPLAVLSLGLLAGWVLRGFL